MKRRGHRAAGVARGGHEDVERLAARGLADARQRRGEETRAEILERRGRPVEQLEHRQLAVIGHRHERRRKIEGIAHDVADLARRADRRRRTAAA